MSSIKNSLLCLAIGIIPLLLTANTSDEEIKAALRLAGHKILLESGDSTSKVLPIRREDKTYVLRFEGEFGFDPDFLSGTVNQIVDERHLASRFLIEVKDCDSNLVVYSYAMRLPLDSTSLSCKGREQESGCYEIYFSIIEPYLLDNESEQTLAEKANSEDSGFSWNWFFYGFGVAFCAVLATTIIRNRNQRNRKYISIGHFRFDERNMQLILVGRKIELTGKESDLLALLYSSLNETVDRDQILNEVWGDEGDYVGRTLDVYVSKLRKKLEADPRVKIINIRGVGYKLVVDQ